MHRRPDRRFLLLSNHGHALVAIAADPGVRIREIAARLGVTERAAQSIVNDLVLDGYVTRTRVGRRNAYTVDERRPLSHPALHESAVGELLASLVPRPGGPDPAHARLATLAAGLLRAQVGLVAVVGGGEESIVGVHGAVDLLGRRRPVAEAITRPVLDADGPLLVEDVGHAPALVPAPLQDLGVRALAGVIVPAPPARPFGVLAVADGNPRRWSADDVRALRLLAEAAGERLERRER